MKHTTDPVQIESIAPLNEFEKEEWRDVARLFRPDWTEEDFDREWIEFQTMKAERLAKRRLQ